MLKISRLLKAGINYIKDLTLPNIVPFLAPIVSYMAYTGEGTEACLRERCLPLPVNYYSPVPEIADLEQRKIWDRRSPMAGIDFQPEAQKQFLLKLGKKFGLECDWPSQPTQDPNQFYTENSSFSFGCAASLHCILREFQPERIIEVGSGFSSQVLSAALCRNAAETGKVSDYTIIDPYPGEKVRQGLPALTKLHKQKVELLDVEFFDRLKENDVLFIDSGYTVRIGGDVNYLILDICPA